jgi:uncharacterized coiled-coil DUF342 family protein
MCLHFIGFAKAREEALAYCKKLDSKAEELTTGYRSLDEVREESFNMKTWLEQPDVQNSQQVEERLAQLKESTAWIYF